MPRTSTSSNHATTERRNGGKKPYEPPKEYMNISQVRPWVVKRIIGKPLYDTQEFFNSFTFKLVQELYATDMIPEEFDRTIIWNVLTEKVRYYSVGEKLKFELIHPEHSEHDEDDNDDKKKSAASALSTLNKRLDFISQFNDSSTFARNMKEYQSCVFIAIL